MYKEIKQCRLCDSNYLISLLNLGKLALSGIFPNSKDEKVPESPLELVLCDKCGLVQLRHTYCLEEMYGDNYGYRSGLNESMVAHLNYRVSKILECVSLKNNDLVVDIGSNDSTLLKAYPSTKSCLNRLGIDPTGKKFKKYYPEDILLSTDFFSVDVLKNNFPNKKAKVITAIAMFYDLESPLQFARDVYECLDDEGIWLIEQSYMPSMLEANAYDTICHEHLEYYGLKQIKYIADNVGFKIIDIEFNKTNGGSFAATLAKKASNFKEANIKNILFEETRKFENLNAYNLFKTNVLKHREDLLTFLVEKKKQGKKVLGYGASTKGNIILQYCNITENEIECIGEVNEDKFGKYTPGTYIPIVSEREVKTMCCPDILMVLPWHFKDAIVRKEQEYLKRGGCLFFPLPYLDTVNAQ
jgi:hypothetical protein